MALMTQNTNGHNMVSQMVTTNDTTTRNDTESEAHTQENLNKKRKNGEETTPTATEAQILHHQNEMEVETNEMRPIQQNHDLLQEEQDLLLH
jgi:hypothetical protein